MPRKVDQEQKNHIAFLFKTKQLGPADIEDELEKEFGKEHAASKATIVRELRKLRLEKETEFGWTAEEAIFTKEGFKDVGTKRRKIAKPMPWTTGDKSFNDEDAAIISQVLKEVVAYNSGIPSNTSVALARWIARLRKSYTLLPAIIIWYAAYEAEVVEFLEFSQSIKSDYRHIDRSLQFEPWKNDGKESLYEEICDKEKIGSRRHWWKWHKELFQKAESSVTHD